MVVFIRCFVHMYLLRHWLFIRKISKVNDNYENLQVKILLVQVQYEKLMQSGMNDYCRVMQQRAPEGTFATLP